MSFGKYSWRFFLVGSAFSLLPDAQRLDDTCHLVGNAYLLRALGEALLTIHAGQCPLLFVGQGGLQSLVETAFTLGEIGGLCGG